MTVCVVGAGIVGLATARDLALRGVDCVLVDRGAAGDKTTTHCAGHLHSGARYALQSASLARACAVSNAEVRALAPFAVSGVDGLFVCLDTDAPEYATAFGRACADAGIAIRPLSRAEALLYEPALGPRVVRAFSTPDTVVDPFLLVEAHLEDLARLGVPVLTEHTLTAATPQGDQWLVRLANRHGGAGRTIAADAVINAAGPGAAEVAAAFGVPLSLTYVNGSMAVLRTQPVQRLVTRCAPTAPGDVVLPCAGAGLIGSTWRPLSANMPAEMEAAELEAVVATANAMIPGITARDVVSTYSGIRARITTSEDARHEAFQLSRDEQIVEHGEQSGMPRLVTAMGGKLTIYRRVAEAAVDAVVRGRSGVLDCRTRTAPLAPPDHPSGRSLAGRGAAGSGQPITGTLQVPLR